MLVLRRAEVLVEEALLSNFGCFGWLAKLRCPLEEVYRVRRSHLIQVKCCRVLIAAEIEGHFFLVGGVLVRASELLRKVRLSAKRLIFAAMLQVKL